MTALGPDPFGGAPTAHPIAQPTDGRRYVTEEGGEGQRFTFAEMAQVHPADETDEFILAENAETNAVLAALAVGEVAWFGIGGGWTWARRVS